MVGVRRTGGMMCVRHRTERRGVDLLPRERVVRDLRASHRPFGELLALDSAVLELLRADAVRGEARRRVGATAERDEERDIADDVVPDVVAEPGPSDHASPPYLAG